MWLFNIRGLGGKIFSPSDAPAFAGWMPSNELHENVTCFTEEEEKQVLNCALLKYCVLKKICACRFIFGKTIQHLTLAFLQFTQFLLTLLSLWLHNLQHNFQEMKFYLFSFNFHVRFKTQTRVKLVKLVFVQVNLYVHTRIFNMPKK